MKPVLPLAMILLLAGAACAPSGYHRWRDADPTAMQPETAGLAVVHGAWRCRLQVREEDRGAVATRTVIILRQTGRYLEETIVTLKTGDGPLPMRQRTEGDWRQAGELLLLRPDSMVSTPIGRDRLTPAQLKLAARAKAALEAYPEGRVDKVQVLSLTTERMETLRADGLRSTCLRPNVHWGSAN